VTLRHCQKLKVGDKFRIPSKSTHDPSGWRAYSVAGIETGAFTAIDEHGYSFRVPFSAWHSGAWNRVMKAAEHVQ
jgi:hypothetical protein